MRTMLNTTLRRSAALLALVAVTASCSSDSITGPAPQTQPEVEAGLLDGLIGGIGGTVNKLLTCQVAESRTTTQTIGPAGGTIFVGRHSLTIPYGALSQDVAITATAPAGDHVELALAPHGLQFERNVTLRMSYADCGLVRALLLRIAYVDRESLRILDVLPSFPDLWRQRIIGSTDHFSSYMLAY
jgi:hypothetical protein